MTDTKTIFITGGSSGFGKAITKRALQQNQKVIATFRNKEEVNVFNQNHGENALGVYCDITNKEQILGCIEEAINHFGQIDVLINNAGYGSFGLFECITRDTYEKQFNVNVMGLIDVTNAILPHMRKQKSGQIFNISSAVGFDGFAGTSIYGASKFAIEGLTIALRQEMLPFNIGVSLIEPGAFNTNFFDNADFKALGNNAPKGYEDMVRKIENDFKNMTKDAEQIGDPDKLAMVVVDLINHNENPSHVPLGADCIEMLRGKIDTLHHAFEEWKDIGSHMSMSDTLKIEKVA